MKRGRWNSRGRTVTKVVGKACLGRRLEASSTHVGNLSQADGIAEAGTCAVCARTVLPIRNIIQGT